MEVLVFHWLVAPFTCACCWVARAFFFFKLIIFRQFGHALESQWYSFGVLRLAIHAIHIHHKYIYLLFLPNWFSFSGFDCVSADLCPMCKLFLPSVCVCALRTSYPFPTEDRLVIRSFIHSVLYMPNSIISDLLHRGACILHPYALYVYALLRTIFKYFLHGG